MKDEKIEHAKGHLKLVAGSVTGDEELEADGRADERASDAKRGIGEVAGKFKAVMDEADAKVEGAIDKVKDALNHQ
jgi:uncharacterized protein YjbJ (UPF0337 family)